MRGLLLDSVHSAVIKVVSAGLTFLMFVYLARALGPEEYGVFGTMFSLGTLGAMAALCGQHTLSLKVLSSMEGEPDREATRRRFIIRSYAIIAIATVACIAGLLLARKVAEWAGIELRLSVLMGAAVFILPFALSDLVAAHMRAFGMLSPALLPRDILWRGGVTLLCLAALVYPWLMPSALTAMVVISGLLLVIIGVQAGYFVRANLPLLSGQGTERAETPRQLSVWMWIASMAMMGANLNIVVASPFLSNDQIGAYFAAHKISQLLLLPVMAINVVAAPTFARLHNQGKAPELQDVGRKLALILAVPLILGAAMVQSLAPELLGLFDSAYAVAAPALLILTMSFLFFGLGGPTQQLMLMAGGERDYVRLTFISDGIGLALVPVLVPHFGIVGAALGLLTSRVLFTIMAVLWCRARLQVDTSILSLMPRSVMRR